ncbi:uncharacterized protein LOC120124728 [Hibiscus syriacus]|uniref:uncharacterized protein LOC120124728 n=1 Tax=Hibiscus syriacus TaxID=106335 RepID=UPI00192080DB|nr:uncharacterized protein LOC120124728 [Hibiscus syriacus]
MLDSMPPIGYHWSHNFSRPPHGKYKAQPTIWPSSTTTKDIKSQLPLLVIYPLSTLPMASSEEDFSVDTHERVKCRIWATTTREACVVGSAWVTAPMASRGVLGCGQQDISGGMSAVGCCASYGKQLLKPGVVESAARLERSTWDVITVRLCLLEQGTRDG